MPFWTFFGATFLGKSFVKTTFQAMFFLAMFGKQFFEIVMSTFGVVLPVSAIDFMRSKRTGLISMFEKQTRVTPSQMLEADGANGVLTLSNLEQMFGKFAKSGDDVKSLAQQTMANFDLNGNGEIELSELTGLTSYDGKLALAEMYPNAGSLFFFKVQISLRSKEFKIIKISKFLLHALKNASQKVG